MSLTREDVIRYLEGLSSDEMADFIEEFQRRVGLPGLPPPAPPERFTMGAPLPDPASLDEWTLHLADRGPTPLQVVKALRQIYPLMTLAEARALVDGAPCTLPGEFHRAEADEHAARLAAAGAVARRR